MVQLQPGLPSHWFYREWICRAEERGAKRLHFLLEDNPGLSRKAIERAKASFSGVFTIAIFSANGSRRKG